MWTSSRGFEKSHRVGTSRNVSGFDFTGATLTFCGYMGSADHRKATCCPLLVNENWQPRWKWERQQMPPSEGTKKFVFVWKIDGRSMEVQFFRIQILSLELLTRPCQCHPWEASHVYHHEAWPISLVSQSETFSNFSISSFAIWEVGRAVLHLGSRRHGADDIESGTRMNLIVWHEA